MKNIFKVIALAFLFACSASHAEVKKVKPTSDSLCKKADGFSKGLSDFIATRKKVSKSSIYLYSASASRNNSGCYIKFDTAKGPDSCSDVDLYTDGNGYWVGGVCY